MHCPEDNTVKTRNRQRKEICRNHYYQQLMRQLYYDIRFFHRQAELNRNPEETGITKEMAESRLAGLLKGLTSVFRKVDSPLIDAFIRTVEPEGECLALIMKASVETLNEKEPCFRKD